MMLADAFALPATQAELQAQAGELATRYSGRAREVRLHGLERDELHPELWREICERGWPGLLVPAEHGGTEGGLLAAVVVLETLAAAGLALWMPVLTSAIAHAIAEVGPGEARAHWLPRVAAGETLFAFAVTEPEVGHNVFRSRTTVLRDGDRYVVNGAKGVTSGLEVAERALVFGRVPEERAFTTVLVDPRAPGVRIEELPMGGRQGVRQWRMELENVEIALDALVGTEGQGLLTLWPVTHVERMLTAALAVGSAQLALDLALARAKERSIFGERPIGAEQAISHPIAMLHARVEATRLLVHRAAARFDAGADGFAVAADANVAKLLSAELVFDAADHALQTLGAQGWDERAGMLDLFLDARMARSGPVSQELALNFVAQHVLGLPSHR